MRLSIAVFIVVVVALPARGQVDNGTSGGWVNRHLAGHVVNYVKKHGNDRRIFSPILGMPRDLSVYLPPGYNPNRTYSLILFFHMASADERYFIGSRLLRELDDLIVRGEFPPAVVACPDGSYDGWNPLNAKHSL
jgi:enterochelin esterase-like enzyme